MNSSEKIIALEQHEQQQQQKNVNKKNYLSKVQTTHSASKND